MTVKEYLSQSYRLNEEIDCKIEQLDSLNGLARKASSTLTGMPHGTGHEGSALENVIVKIVDLQNEINADIERLVDLKREIGRLINSVEDKDLRMILQMRYLCWKQWPEIAVEMNVTLRRLYYLHGLALKKIQG